MRDDDASNKIDVYLEIGRKKTFAGAIDWPGWCRSARDEALALQALVRYGPRYARVLDGRQLEFRAPDDATVFAVVERLQGDATTDFGAPGQSPAYDAGPVDAAELQRLQEVLEACWQAFNAAVQAASGRELTKGPRGGGRDLTKIVRHLMDSDAGYLSALGWKPGKGNAGDAGAGMAQVRREILSALTASAAGEIPAMGPRGGVRWTPRYFVRRLAWHALDHTWEIEDRSVTGQEQPRKE
jgi:hypothetical protein